MPLKKSYQERLHHFFPPPPPLPQQVSFLITEDPSRTRVKRETLSPDRFNLYVNLAHSSGGQIIFTDNENIRKVTEIVGESSIFSVKDLGSQVGGERMEWF